MKLKTSLIIVAAVGILGACQSSPTSQTGNLTQEQVTEKRDKVLNMADKALARLYAVSYTHLTLPTSDLV